MEFLDLERDEVEVGYDATEGTKDVCLPEVFRGDRKCIRHEVVVELDVFGRVEFELLKKLFFTVGMRVSSESIFLR